MVGGIEWSDGSWMSHQRCAGWLGGKAEFPCGLPGRLWASARCWTLEGGVEIWRWVFVVLWWDVWYDLYIL